MHCYAQIVDCLKSCANVFHCRHKRWCMFEFGFYISLVTFGKQMAVYHSELTILRSFKDTVTIWPVFPQKTSDHFLWSASCADNFCWVWLILEDSRGRLLFTFGLICIDPWFVTCHDLINYKCFWNHSTNRHEHFFERLSNYVRSNANKSLLRLNFHAISYTLIILMPRRP